MNTGGATVRAFTPYTPTAASFAARIYLVTAVPL